MNSEISNIPEEAKGKEKIELPIDNSKENQEVDVSSLSVDSIIQNFADLNRQLREVKTRDEQTNKDVLKSDTQEAEKWTNEYNALLVRAHDMHRELVKAGNARELVRLETNLAQIRAEGYLHRAPDEASSKEELRNIFYRDAYSTEEERANKVLGGNSPYKIVYHSEDLVHDEQAREVYKEAVRIMDAENAEAN